MGSFVDMCTKTVGGKTLTPSKEEDSWVSPGGRQDLPRVDGGARSWSFIVAHGGLTREQASPLSNGKVPGKSLWRMWPKGGGVRR